MARGDTQKPKRAAAKQPAKKPAAKKTSPANALDRLEDRVRALEGERESLKTELNAALARVRDLEAEREQVANRIDWVVDSLESVLEARN